MQDLVAANTPGSFLANSFWRLGLFWSLVVFDWVAEMTRARSNQHPQQLISWTKLMSKLMLLALKHSSLGFGLLAHCFAPVNFICRHTDAQLIDWRCLIEFQATLAYINFSNWYSETTNKVSLMHAYHASQWRLPLKAGDAQNVEISWASPMKLKTFGNSFKLMLSKKSRTERPWSPFFVTLNLIIHSLERELICSNPGSNSVKNSQWWIF